MLLDRVRDFPKEITDAPLVTEINSGVMPVMEMSLSGDLSYEKLHEIAEDLSVTKFLCFLIPKLHTNMDFGIRNIWLKLMQSLKKSM